MLLLYRGESFDPNFYYHSGVDIDHSFLLSDGRRKTLLTPKMNEPLARARFRGKVAVYGNAFEDLARLIKGRKVLIDGRSMSALMHSRLKKICRMKDHSQALLRMRSQKKPAEMSDIRKAVRLTKEIFESLDMGKAGTEEGLHRQLMLETAERGLEPAFEPIVSSGAGTAFPHYRAGKRKLGGIVLVDYGVRWNHYCADLTRCFILDGDRRKKEEYERLRDICFFLADSLPSLRTGKEAAELADSLVAKAGFPKMVHAIGHGVGLEIHELPHIGMKSDDSLRDAALAIEPAFYRAGRYGMRYEETVWSDGKRSRVL
ncbi:MAG: M24 family metallopeptidase [Candidatus Micrarchaeota archaeon]